MSERDTGTEDPRSKLTRTQAVAVSTFMGAFTGGISYGITSALSEGDLDRKVGIGVGGSVSSLYTGLFLAFDSSIRAKEYAIQGHMGRAMLKVLQAGTENVLGFGAGSAIPAYEAAGAKGALIAGVTGAFFGTTFASVFSKDVRHIGKAYREAIIPARDPLNFPGHRVINHEGFDNNDLLAEKPPVYRAYTFEDMINFRQEQADEIITKSPSMSGDFKSPEYLLSKINEAIFVIPDVSHHPDLDPDSKNLSIKLIDLESNELITPPHREPSYLIWTSPTAFDDRVSHQFSKPIWRKWKEAAWKRGVVVLAKRNVNRVAEETNPNKIVVEDQYYLIDIISDGTPRGRRRRTRLKEENILGLIPGLEPKRL